MQSIVDVYVNFPRKSKIRFLEGETFFQQNNLRKGYGGIFQGAIFLWRSHRGGI